MQPPATYRVIQKDRYYYRGENLQEALLVFAMLIEPLILAEDDIVRASYTEHTVYKTPVIAISVLHTEEEKRLQIPSFLTVLHGCSWEDWQKYGPQDGFDSIEELEARWKNMKS